MPLTPALGRQRQMDLREFEASLAYCVSSRTARASTAQGNPVWKNKQTKKQQQKGKEKKRNEGDKSSEMGNMVPGVEGGS